MLYTDAQNGNQWRAGPCDVRASRLQIPAVPATELMNGLLITAAVSCEQIQTRKLLMTNVKFAFGAKQALWNFNDLTMQAYDGRGPAR